MNKELKQKWINALRSGKYMQGRAKLINDKNEFCCLGVLCEVALLDTKAVENDDQMGYDPIEKIVGQEMVNKLWKMNDGTVNDNTPPHSFNEIADWIESNIVGE